MNMGGIWTKGRAQIGCTLALGAMLHSAQAATIYWDGTGTSWNSVGSWSTGITNITNPAAIPGSADVATFNVDGLNVLQTVTLDANQLANGLSLNSNATGGVTLLGGGTDRSLTLGSGGIGINAAAGPMTIGSATAGQGVALILSANQSWTNNSASVLTIQNNVTNSAAATLTLAGSGSGGVTVNGVISNGTGTTSLTVNNGNGSVVNTLTGNNSYTGATTVTRGALVLAGPSGALQSTAGLTISNEGTLVLDDRGAASSNINRLADTNAITLNNGSSFVYRGSDQAATNSSETIGAVTLGSGRSTITVGYNGSNTAVLSTNSGSFTRTAGTGGIALVNGANLGGSGSSSASRFLLASAPTLVGTTNATSGINAGVHNTKIVPYLLGESAVASGGAGTATGIANTFLTYDATTGLRPLNPTDEFSNNVIVAGDNTRITADTTVSASVAINSLVISGGDLYINDSTTLTNTSGALLFTSNNSIRPSGTSGVLSFGTAEGLISANAGVTAKILTGLAGSNGATIYGPGRVLLGGTVTNTGTISVANGGTLVFGADNVLGSSTFAYVAGAQVQSDGPNRNINTRFNLTSSALTIGGSGDVTFTGNGSTPAFTIANFSNQALNIVNTGTTTISGAFSLVNAGGTTVNNGSAFVSLGSGVNLVVTGPILDNNAGNQAVGGASSIAFNGTGSNITLSPTVNNSFGATKTMSVSGPSAGIGGYNTITVGGPGGSGATITPFGQVTSLTSNTQGAFLMAAESGQILGNNISSGASGSNFAFTHGFAGSNDLTLGGTFSTAATGTFANIATGTFTFGSTVSLANSASVFTILGSGNTVFNSASTLSASTGTFAKVGSGTLTLAGTNNMTGVNSFSGGTVILDYSGSNANRLGANTTATALTLSGVNLQLNGGSYAQGLGVGGGTTLSGGQSRISRNGGSSTIALGAITRAENNAGLIDFAAGNIASTTSGNTNGILGKGWATVGGSDWATVSGGNIVALASYGDITTAGSNALLSGNGSSGAVSLNTLKIGTTASGQSLSLSGQLTVAGNGILFVGSDDYSVTGSSIRGNTSTAGDLIVHQNGAGVLSIDSNIVNGTGTSGLTKSGSGTLVLNGTNTYSGTTSVRGGALQVSSSANLGTGGIVLDNGTLRTTAGFSTNRAVALGANGGTFQADSGTLDISGVVSSGAYSGLTKTGNGTLLLSAANTYRGPTNINAGTLQLGNNNALGDSSIASNRAVSPVNVNGGTLDIAGYNANVGNVVLAGGSINDSVGTGSLNAYSYTLQSGTVNARLADLQLSATAANNSINLYKTTAGTATINSNSSYSGTTYVNAGTLVVNGTLANSGARVAAGATLAGNGTIGRDSIIEGNLSAGNSPGQLTFNQDLTLAATSNSIFEINGLTPGLQFDSITVLGDMLYDGTLTVSFGFTPVDGQSFALFNVTGLSSGTFDAVNVLGGYTGNFDAASGLFTVNAVPEPSTYALLLTGALALYAVRRRVGVRS